MDGTDESLVIGLRGGDPAFLRELFQRHAAGLLAYLRRMLGDPRDAEEVLHETFRRVVTGAGSFDAERRFRPWLFAIAYNLSVDALRKRRRQLGCVSLDVQANDARDGQCGILPPLHERVPDGTPDPSETADIEDRRHLVQDAIRQLPPRQRAALILAYYHDMNYPEVAEAMGCSPGTVKTHMSRALHTLADRLPSLHAVPHGGDQ
jgi:RNA polymerase sigma-70 factor (ECF subfamily)